VFLVQSGLLSALVRYRNRALLAHDNSSSEELIIEYVSMYNRGGLKKFMFNYGPISIPFPELREKIEYKIIQEFFVRNYNLPPEFKFANYMCGVLRHYVISLVEVRPISWIVLACFVCLNLFRIEVIDPILARSVCERYPAKNLDISSSHRLLTSLFATIDDVEDAQEVAYGKHVCQEYLLRYTFVLLFFIMFYVIGVLVASEVYIQRLVGKVLDQEETIEWLENEEKRTQQLAFLSQHGGPDAQDPDGYVDIHHLPDDSFAADNPQRRASKEESTGLDAGAGIELTHMGYPTPKTSQDSSVSHTMGSVENSSGKGQLGPRRMSAAFRQPSGKVRTGSAADIPEELADHLPPVPVYGAANVRRLSMLHRRNSAKGDDLATLIAAGIAGMESHDNHATSPRRLSVGNRAGGHRPPLSLELPGQQHHQVHSPATAPPHKTENSVNNAPTTSKSLDTDTNTKANGASSGGVDLPMRRRLASHHRMGSLRSEISQIEAESGVRRLQPHHRQGSLRSDASENFSQKHTEGKETKLLTSHNRRFLYLRCLERIMHVEFDFHANEARRMGQQEQVSSRTGSGTTAGPNNYTALSSHGPEKSPRRITRGNSNFQGGTSMRDLLQSPAVQQRERPGGRLPRTYSASSLQEGLSGTGAAYNPDVELMHTDMRSNFRLMKDLRAEMLQEEKALAMLASPAPEANQASSPRRAVMSTRKILGSLNTSTHSNTNLAPPRTRPETPPPRPPPIVSTASIDLELGGPAVQELHEIEIAQGRDYDYEDPSLPHNMRKKRDRTFSLAYVQPGPNGIINRSTSKTFEQRQYEHMSLCDKLSYNVRACFVSMYHRMVSALLGHHIGEAEAEVDADIADLQEDFTHIFMFRSAEFYYFCVEFSLLAQCVYLALWATNFVFIANDSYYPVLWNIALLVPVPINFLLTKQIIFTSVMLKSIVTLDKFVADRICEEAVDERNVKHRVRKVIRTALRTLEIPRDTWEQFTMDQFELYIPDNDVGLNLANLKLFLHSLQIFLTDATVKRIFTVLDFDKDDRLLWDEMMPIIFPELVRKQVLNLFVFPLSCIISTLALFSECFIWGIEFVYRIISTAFHINLRCVTLLHSTG